MRFWPFSGPRTGSNTQRQAVIMVKATVVAIITKDTEEGKQVLLARRNTEPYRDLWSLPGGHIEPYETAKDAIIREVNEEIGLDFEPHFFCYFDEIIPERNIHAVVIVFEGSSSGRTRLSPHEISDIRWTPLSHALLLSLAFLQNRILEEYMKTLSEGKTHE